MSTRCQIAILRNELEANKVTVAQIKKAEALIYRHSDGGKDAVVSDILPFLTEFKKERGLSDVEYLGACLVTYLKQWHCGEPFSKYENKSNALTVNGIQIDYLGHGIGRSLHWDIEYLYVITPTTLHAFAVNCSYPANKFTFKNLDNYPL